MLYEYKLRYFAQFLKNAPFLLALIIQATDFFEKDLKSKSGSELTGDKDVIFIGFLLLKFSLISSSNIEHVSN